ncbi:MAG: hypothetical protein F6K42_25135 [Leptolyngbya sp. SIO1D8]|nr:hypothetical protein [Leptolyngbya sp. SIO1D8]
MASDRLQAFLSSISDLSDAERQAAIAQQIAATKQFIVDNERQVSEIDAQIARNEARIEHIKNEQARLREWLP